MTSMINKNSHVHVSIPMYLAKSFPLSLALDGSLKVLNQLDYDSGPTQYILTIRVQDLGTPFFYAETDINICILDVNDNGPKFTESNLDPVTVMENEEDGQFIASFVVTDRDGPPYDRSVVRIVSGNELDAFYLNENTTSLYVKNGSLLDYESDDTAFTITVLAEDPHNPLFNDTASVSTCKSVLCLFIHFHPLFLCPPPPLFSPPPLFLLLPSFFPSSPLSFPPLLPSLSSSPLSSPPPLSPPLPSPPPPLSPSSHSLLFPFLGYY